MLVQIDHHLLTKIIEPRVVWWFEYHYVKTRFALARFLNIILAFAMPLANQFSPEPGMSSIIVAAGVWWFLDRRFLSLETEALKEAREKGPAPNPHRSQSMVRLIGIGIMVALLLYRLLSVPTTTLETLFVGLAAFTAILAMYVLAADPVPDTYTPRAKRWW